MVVLGLEEDITTQAARQVALNAGGRIAETFSGLLGPDDIDRLAGLEPDLILLSGGTNGGDTACLVGNAKSLAKAGLAAVIVVAGNVEAQAEAGRHLESADATGSPLRTSCPRSASSKPRRCRSPFATSSSRT